MSFPIGRPTAPDLVNLYEPIMDIERRLRAAEYKQAHTSSSGIADGDYGDIIVSLSATSWTIDPAYTAAVISAATAAASGIASLTTDVVAAGPGAAVATIQPNVVSNAKLAQAPAQTIKGNPTGGTANEQDMSPAVTKALLAITAADVSGLPTSAAASPVDPVDLERRFRLLLRQFVITFGVVPRGLENETGIALSI